MLSLSSILILSCYTHQVFLAKVKPPSKADNNQEPSASTHFDYDIEDVALSTDLLSLIHLAYHPNLAHRCLPSLLYLLILTQPHSFLLHHL